MNSQNKSSQTEVSVDDAIKKGQLFVFNAQIALLLIFVLGPMLLSSFDWIEDKTSNWLSALGFVFILIYRSIATTKWRIWAFSNVRNVHQLQTKALDRSIITEPGGFWEKTEFKTKREKEILAKLQLKFKQPDIYKRPKNYPETIKIYTSRPIIAFHFVLATLLMTGLGFSFYEGNRDWYLMLFFIGIIYYAQGLFRQLIDRKPQLILSKKGIESKEHKLYKWSAIKDFTIKKRMSNKSYEYYLEYGTPSKFVSFCLRDLHVGVDELREAFRIYGNKKEQ